MSEPYEEREASPEEPATETGVGPEEPTLSETPAPAEEPTAPEAHAPAEEPVPAPPFAGDAPEEAPQAYEPMPSAGGAADRLAGWQEQLRGISLGTWLVASMLGLLAFVLLVALLAFVGIRGSRRAAQEVAINTNARIQQLQAQIDTLNRELEALQAANVELQRSLENRLDDELQALRQEFQRADQQLQDDVQRTLNAQGRELRNEVQTSLDEVSRDVSAIAVRTRLEVLLLRASRQALQARIHLAERKPGLAKRDLRAVEAALNEAAETIGDPELQAAVGSLRDSIRELREGIEAETFPVTTVEVLIEKIDEVLQAVAGQQ